MGEGGNGGCRGNEEEEGVTGWVREKVAKVHSEI